MTIGIAAVCESNCIIGVSDRMITAEDVQYEPFFQKQLSLTGLTGMLIADDLTVHVEIIKNLATKVRALVNANPNKVLPVSEVADLYAKCYTDEFVKRAERKYLAPLKLDMDSFLTRQNEFKVEFVNNLTEDMRQFSLPKMEALIAGVDDFGGHIYQVYNGEVTPQDISGFSSIGAGYWHANSAFMAAKHTRLSSVPDTILLAYRAKKRAEMAGGVGKQTDMFIIGSGMPYTTIPEEDMKRLDRIYEKAVKKEQRITAQAIEEVKQHAEDFYKRWEEARKKADAAGGGQDTAPANQDGVRGITDAGESEDGRPRPPAS